MRPESYQSPTLLQGFYQLAYVTHDIDRTIADFQRMGVSEFRLQREVVNPGGSGAIRHMAKAWCGSVMIELIQPRTDRSSIYDAAIPADQTAFLHHFGCDVATDAIWAATTEETRNRGLAVVSAGHVPGVLNYSYVDTRRSLGLMLEHVQLFRSDFYDDVPHNPADADGLRPLFKDIDRVSYVARDLDQTIAGFAHQAAVTSFVLTPPQRSQVEIRRLRANCDGLAIDLIEPRSHVASALVEALPNLDDGAVTRLFSVGSEVKTTEAFEAVIRTAQTAGLEAQTGHGPHGGPVVWIDARAALGHWLTFQGPEGPSVPAGPS